MISNSESILIEGANEASGWKNNEKELIEKNEKDLKQFVFKIGLIFTAIQAIWFLMIYLAMLL